jgi:hypothetical protein
MIFTSCLIRNNWLAKKMSDYLKLCISDCPQQIQHWHFARLVYSYHIWVLGHACLILCFLTQNFNICSRDVLCWIVLCWECTCMNFRDPRDPKHWINYAGPLLRLRILETNVRLEISVSGKWSRCTFIKFTLDITRTNDFKRYRCLFLHFLCIKCTLFAG